MKVAAVTMAYNEPDFLPLWVSYYVRQLGAAACYVIDHGSEDGSTQGLPVNVIRIPRSVMDDAKRAKYISEFCSSLLAWYDAVIYCDTDEFLVPDPVLYNSLVDFCEASPPVTTAIGFDVQDTLDRGHFTTGTPVLSQRPYARISYACCKPLVIKEPTTWTPGFHHSNHPTVFDELVLFHLRLFDTKIGLKKLARTREMPWADPTVGGHQRVSDEKYLSVVTSISKLPRVENCTLSTDDPLISANLKALTDYMKQNPGKKHCTWYAPPPSLELIRVPDRFHTF